MRKLVSVCLFLLSAAIQLNAQVKTSRIYGRVKTADGQAAAGVSIMLKNTSRGAVSGSDGRYEIRRITPGEHILEISFVGYETQLKSLSLAEGEARSFDIDLALSAAELNEVIVRAQHKRYHADNISAGLRNTGPALLLPQNVQVVTADVIRDQQIFDMSEGVTRNVSGASYSAQEHWGNYSNIMVRGSTATPLRNGLNFDMPWGPLVEDLSMVDRIEFAKGPSGFMFANAEPSGLYNIVTKKPTGIDRGEVAFTLGSFDTYRSTLDLDGRLSSDGRLLYRLNMMGQFKNSHRQFDFTNRYSVAPVLAFRINENTTLTAEFTHQRMKMAMLGSSYLFSPNFGDLPRKTSMLESNLQPTDIREHNAIIALTHQLSADWKFTTQMGVLYYLQEGSSIWPSYPAGLQRNGDLVRSIANWDAAGQARLGQMFINGQLMTGRVKHRVLAALDIAHKHYYADFYQFHDITSYDIAGSSIPFNVYDHIHAPVPLDKLPKFDRTLPLRQRGGGIMGESSSSVYLQDELSFAQERIRLTIAGRHTTLEQHSFGTYSSDKEFTPRAGLSVSLDRATALYGLYDRTFLAQQGRDSAGLPFVPLTGATIEAGIKRDWQGGKWNSTLSLYRVMRNNLISYIPGPEFKAIQTGQTRTKGIELDVRGELFSGMNLVLNYAYNTAQITKDEDPNRVGGPVDGPGFPKHITNGWFTYLHGSKKGHGLSASLGYQFMMDRPHDLPDYFRLDGAMQWRNEHLTISVNANNLLNRYLFTGAPYEYNNDFTTTEYYFMTEAGTNFRLSAAYTW